MEMELLQVVAAGGDLATVLIFGLLWKMDKRISKVEWHIESNQAEQT